MKMYWLLALLVLASCSAVSDIGGGVKGFFTGDRPVTRVGESGLEISFVNGMPPDLVRIHDKFIMGLELQNTGATDINDGMVTLVNYYPKFITLDHFTYRIGENGVFEGKKEYNAQGGYELVTFNAEANKVMKGVTEEEFLFKAKACYPYETLASASICINTNKNILKTFTDVCQPEPVNMPKGQGAPVAVTKIEERIYDLDVDSSVLQLTLYVENFGKGKITNRFNYKAECEGSVILTSNLNKMDIQIQFSQTELTTADCKAPKVDSRDSNKMTIFCSKEIPKVRSAYKTPLMVKLSYGYITPDLFKKVKVASDSTEYPCEGSCVPLDKNQYGGSAWGICSPAFGGDAEGSCGQGFSCCERSAPVCNDLQSENLAYACRPEAECNRATVRTGKCPGSLVCCVPPQGQCDPANCKEESVCINGYGGVDSTKSCSDGKACCKSSKSCADLVVGEGENEKTYRCFEGGQPGFDTCQDEQFNFCPSRQKCCLRDSALWEGSCDLQDGHCIATLGYPSCEAYGSESPGRCSTGFRCCEEDTSKCELDHPSQFTTWNEPGKWSCVTNDGVCESTDPADEKIQTGLEGRQVCPGNTKTCCQVKHTCQSKYQGAKGCYAAGSCKEGSIDTEISCESGLVCCQRT
ncbi:MAG: hypothetical protein V1735_01710 [Nanoarchaeota archaeon]